MTEIVRDSIPGLGDKLTLELDDSSKLVIIKHRDGTQDVYHGEKKLLSLSQRDALAMISMLAGSLISQIEGGG